MARDRHRRIVSRLFWPLAGLACEAIGRASLAVLLWLGGPLRSH